MGYTTDFYGSVAVEPPLNEHEISYLTEFAGTRRMARKRGPYFAHDDGNFGQGVGWGGDKDDDILAYNNPADAQPGLWCQWVPSLDGSGIEWDGGEKFYYSAEWMKYLIDHFLKPAALLEQRLGDGWFEHNGYFKDDRFQHFTFDHVVNGQIEARGEDPGDHWMLVVVNNVVKTAGAVVGWADAVEL